MPKDGFEVAREIANSFVEGQPRQHALKTIDAYEKAYHSHLATSKHYDKVKAFMQGAKQDCPETPCIPSEDVRLLRAKLILEEALETVEALGFDILLNGKPSCQVEFEYVAALQPDLELIVDGCCDIKVVTTGTLIACGVPDDYVQDMVDENNLDKIQRGTLREDGKLIKPPDHRPPDIAGFLKEIEDRRNE